MKKQSIFTGSGVAIVTPFKENEIDYDAFAKIIEFQIANKTDAIIVCGTTGEASTLTDDEHVECIRFAAEKVAGRVPVVAGTGSNDTAYAVWMSESAQKVGADALLLVSPYYNKATHKGLVRHFSVIADSVDIPSIIYNVPSRTGCNIPLSVYRELAEHSKIVGVKEASGNISAIAELAAECGSKYDIYSGNDDQIVPILSLGGSGVISVVANIMPRQTHDICALYLEGKVKESAALQLEILDLINKLFVEVNPIPVKTAMHYMGFCTPELRMPLCEMEESYALLLKALMQKHGLVSK